MLPTARIGLLLASTLLGSTATRMPAQAENAAALPADRASGAATISQDDMRNWLTHLASPELRGRETGERGFELAAEFMRTQFRELGLKPVGENFFSRVPWTRTGLDEKETFIRFQRGDKVLWSIDIAGGLKATGTKDSESRAPLAFATFDGDLEELDALDLDDCNVIVVAATKPITNLRTYYRISRAIRTAGGRLVAVANTKLADRIKIGTTSIPGGPTDRAAAGRYQRPRVFAMKNEWLDAAFASLGSTPRALAEAEEGYIRFADIECHAQAKTTHKPAPAFNVGAVLRGSDPELRDQHVLIGCHLDHLGGDAKVFHPGADDDGSGSVGLLAIARAFAKNPVRPRRSLMFVAFCGEEKGLIGSAHFAKNPPVPLESIVAELQIDMIGRSEASRSESAEDNRNCLHLIGSKKLSTDLHELCLRLNRERSRFDLEWDEEDVFYRSDHWNFAREGVPVAFFFTGFHADYHKPTDTVDKIEFPKLQRVATYVYDIAFELAQADTRPLIEPAKWNSLKRRGRRTPVAPLRK